MHDDFEIHDQVEWEPDDDLKSGVPWAEDKNYPGGYFYYDNCEDNLIKILTDTLNRSNPREPESYSHSGGQGEYFESVDRDIIGIGLLTNGLLGEDQITKDHTDSQSQTQIRTEGNKRLKSCLPYHKNPPIVIRSPDGAEFKIQSGHNRTEDFQNRYPNELMLVVIVGDPKVHQKASCTLADVRAKLRANPQSRTRAPTIADRALAIKEAFLADKFIHDQYTGKPHNPNGKKLNELDKDGDVWKDIFEYICGDGIHQQTRTKVYNKVTGNKVTRRIVVGPKAVADDLHTYGWADGLIRENGKILTDYRRVSWHDHTDIQNGALIIAKEVSGNHFDTAMYGFIEKLHTDQQWVVSLADKGITKIFLHANLGSQIDSENSLKKAQEKLLEKCETYNQIAKKSGYLEIKKVLFPRQQANIPAKLHNI